MFQQKRLKNLIMKYINDYGIGVFADIQRKVENGLQRNIFIPLEIENGLLV